MSVMFDLRGAEWPEGEYGERLPPAEMYVQFANSNAREFLAWVGLRDAAAAEGLCGSMRVRELEVVLRKVLGDEKALAHDQGRFGVVEGRFHQCARPAGRFVDAARRLLRLAEEGGDLGVVSWS